MKKITISILFSMMAIVMYAQEATILRPSGTFSQFGHVSIGTVHDFWEHRLLDVYKPSGNVNFRIGNDLGKLNISIAGHNGAFSPIAKTGDVVITKQTTDRVIFNLNNTANDGNHAFIFGDNLNYHTLSILNNGRAGIGTDNPLSKLHVNGGLRITGSSPNNGDNPSLIFGESGDSNNEYGKYVIQYLDNQGLNFAIPWPNSGFGNYDLFLSTSRRVGIGTNNVNCSNCSGYKLFVKDGIKTEKVKVVIASEDGWADYVFNKEYPLKSLQEVALFIHKNNHLPEMPSATEIVENGGVELKEMTVLLLKKIEELTLYTIQQQKMIEELQKKIDQSKEEKN